MKLRILPLLREVGVAYASHWKLLVPMALLVLLPQAVTDALFGDIEIDGVHDAGDVVKLAELPISVGINLGGEALYAGIIAAVVVQWQAGNATPDLRATARHIAYGRLILLDMVLVLGTALGLVLLIVPGVLVFTYLLISPTLIEIEGIRIREAIDRSIALVRGNFWRVLALAAGALVTTDTVGTALESPLHGLHGEVIFNLLIEAVLEPFQGLTTVLLALALMKLHGQSPQTEPS